MKKRGLLVLVGMLVLFVIICCAMTAACADGDQSQELLMTLSEAEDGQYWVNNELIQIFINATGAKELDVTVLDCHGESIQRLHVPHDPSITYENYDWAWNSAEWGSQHEHVIYGFYPTEAGEYTIHATAYYWTSEATPTDLNDITKKEKTMSVQIDKQGDIGDPMIGLADGSVIERGTLIDIPVTPGTNAGEVYASVYSADDEYIPTTDIVNGSILLPTWELAAGEYYLYVGSYTPKYVTNQKKIKFFITENNWSKPTSPIYYARTSTGEVTQVDTAEPFDIVVYIPNADEYEINLQQGERNLFKANRSAETFVARSITAYNSGNVELHVAARLLNGAWNQNLLNEENFLTVKPGRNTLPEITLTCDQEVLPIGQKLELGISVGEADPEEDYSGVQYTLSLRMRNAMNDYLTIKIDPNITEYEIDSGDDNLFRLREGDSFELIARAYGRGFEGKSVSKKILMVESGVTDGQFRLSINDEDGDIRLPKNKSYTAQITGLPENVNEFWIYNGWWYKYDVNPEEENGQQVTLWGSLSVQEDVPLVARYQDSEGEYHLSNIIYMTFYSYGPLELPEVTTNLTEGQDGTYSIAQGTTIECLLTNPEDYTGKGDVQIYYELIDPEQGDYGHIRDGYCFCHNSLTYQIATWDLETNRDYNLRVRALNGNGYDSSASVDIPFTVTEADIPESGILFTVSKTEVLTGEEIFYTVFAPGATQTRIWVERPGSDYHEIDDDSNSPVISGSHTWDYNPGEITYYAQAQFPGEDEPRTATIEGSITAPYGYITDYLQMEEFSPYITAGESKTIRFGSTDAEEEIIPDEINISIHNASGNQWIWSINVHGQSEITIPAKKDDGTNLLASGNRYQVWISASKKGYNRTGYWDRVLIAQEEEDAAVQVKVNGRTTEQTIACGTEFTVSADLPSGTTRYEIWNGDYWNKFEQIEAGDQAIQISETLVYGNLPKAKASIYARYTSDPAGTEDSAVQWQYTKTVTVNFTCNHSKTKTFYDWTDVPTYTESDDQYHLIQGHGSKVVSCAYCGKVFTRVEDADISDPQEHEFDSFTRQCYQCGCECKHPNTTEVAEDTETIYYEWASTTQHRKVRTVHVHMECPDCQFSGETEYKILSETLENHQMGDGGLCTLCGMANQESFRWDKSTGEYNTVTLDGLGTVPGCETAGANEWVQEINESKIEKVIIGENITAIGPYALAGIDHEVHIDFRGRKMPQIDSTAFTGSRVICRYYYDDASWTGGQFGGTAEWIRLPYYFYNQDTELYYTVVYSKGKWQIRDQWNGEDIDVDNLRQAIELTWKRREYQLYGWPSTADETLIREHVKSTNILRFYTGVSGEHTFTFNSEGTENFFIYAYSPQMNLTITDTATSGKGIHQLNMQDGTVVYTGNIEEVVLNHNYSETNEGDLTVNGQVGVLNLYDATYPDYGYGGDLTVNGTISSGYVYGQTTMSIPKIDNPIPVKGTVNTRLTRSVEQDSKIVTNGELTLSEANADAAESITTDYTQYNLYYDLWYNDGWRGWRLRISPKESGIGTGYMEDIILLDEYMNDGSFEEKDIFWGQDTEITIADNPSDPTPITINGEKDGQGNKTGPSTVRIYQGDVTINCPVGIVSLEQQYGQYNTCVPSTVIINDAVRSLSLSGRNKIGSISTGAGGSVERGEWYRLSNDTWYFGSVAAEKTIYANNTLQRMSWKDGQNIQAILPANETVTAKVPGAGGNQKAILDVNDSEATLDDEENRAFEKMLTDEHITEPMTATAAFDAGVVLYDEDEEYGITGAGTAIHTLSNAVSVTVKNITGEPAFVVRLHEDETGEMTATKMTDMTTEYEPELTFNSALFSKYLLVTRYVEGRWNRNDWSLEYENGWILMINGYGDIPDYSSADAAPWSSEIEGKTISRVIISAGITSIGSNVFGGMTGDVRFDFLQEEMPEIAADAFAGTTAYCRYYSEDNSWTTGTAGRTEARWVYLPEFAETHDGSGSLYWRKGEDNTFGWYASTSNGLVSVDEEQADELTYKGRSLYFDAIPNKTAEALYATSNVEWSADFRCSGEYTINAANGGNMLNVLKLGAPDLTITVDHSQGERPITRIWAGEGGTLEYTGDVSELFLCNSQTIQEEGDSPQNDVTINGNIELMTFYGPSTGETAYRGDLKVVGLIGKVIVYGEGTIDIPGVGDNIPIDVSQIGVINNLTLTQDNGSIIQNSTLTCETNPLVHEISDYNLEYWFYSSDNIQLVLRPKEEGYPTYIPVLTYNENFTPANIIWGEDTSVGIYHKDGAKIILNGGTENGTCIGFNRLHICAQDVTIELNCPIDNLWVVQDGVGQSYQMTLDINNTVKNGGYLELSGKQNLIRLGTNGRLLGSTNWKKRLHTDRAIHSVTGKCTLVQDGQLCVLSAREGESFESILPGDTALETATGKTTAVLDMTGTTLEENEAAKLDDILNAQADHVENVIDVTVTDYASAEGEGTPITKLGENVRMAVENTTGGAAYIARLHENDSGELIAEAITIPTSSRVLWFESDLFSKYAVIERNLESIKPDFSRFMIPGSVKVIEEDAFAGIAAEAVRIPDGCTTIQGGAFSGPNIWAVYVPASVNSIGENAFPKGTIIYMPVDNETSAWLRNHQYEVVIIQAGDAQ